MKKLNFLTLVCTLFMSVSLTSCLNTDDEGTGYEAILQVHVDNYYGAPIFIDAVGNQLWPTSKSMAYFNQNGYDLTDYDMAIIYFNYVDDETGTVSSSSGSSTTPQNYDIELVAFSPMDMLQSTGVQTAEEMETAAPETAPMLTLKQSTSAGTLIPYLFDSRTAVAYTGFWLTNDKDMFEEHSLKMVYVCDEINTGSEDLVLYLRHDRGDDDGTESYYANYYGLNIQGAVSYFKSITGRDPNKIILKAKECTYGTTELPEGYVEYEIEYETSTTE